MNRYPEIRIDVDLSDRQIDLIEENIDLAIRVGDLSNSTLVARKLADVHFATCASPAYLETHGEPAHPSELIDHEVVVYSNISVGGQWFYELDGKRVNPRMKYRLTANNGEFLAAVSGSGHAIVNGPVALLQPYIDNGSLRPILQRHPRPMVGMYAVYPPGRLVPGRVRRLSDSIFEYFRERDI